MYGWRSNACIDLTFRLAQHDATNVQSLDVSGNDHHAEWGDGVTPAKYPTKLDYRRGYNFDGTTDYMEIDGLTGVLNMTAVSFAMTFRPEFEVDEDTNRALFADIDAQYTVAKADNAGANVLNIYLGATLIAAIAQATWEAWWNVNQVNTLVVSSSSVTDLTNVWLNEGHILVDDPTAWAPADITDMVIGAMYLFAVYTAFFDGDIFHFMARPAVMTPTQIMDYHRQMLKKVNDI